jgi:DNA adenine methylase
MNHQQLLFQTAPPALPERPVNVASVPQRSPFRYPGGKTWLIPVLRRWLTNRRRQPDVLLEAFAGGAIVSLTAAFEQLARHVVFVELDAQVAAVWQSILHGDAEWLADRIVQFDLSLESLRRELSKHAGSNRELAFQTILRNRTARGGILASGAGFVKTGEGDRGLNARWYPATLARRIREIAFVAERLTFVEGDAFDFLAKFRHNPSAVFFIDPPYTAGGKRAGSRLYSHSEIDHERLFHDCALLEGDFLMTYDNAPEVIRLAERHGFAAKAIPMKNTHHAEMSELLISRSFEWFV